MENTFDLIGHRHVMLRDNTLKVIETMQSTSSRSSSLSHFVTLLGAHTYARTSL